MKILAIGDFHGTFPSKFKKIIKKEKIDAIISVGDYCPFSYRSLFFKYSYHQEKELWEIIGKNKLKQLIQKDLAAGESVLKTLNSFGIPVFTIHGNVDHANTNDSYEKIRITKSWKWENQDFFSSMVKKYKNISRIDYRPLEWNGYHFIGIYGGSSPGDPQSSAFKMHQKKIAKFFEKNKKNKNYPVIFVSHNPPNNTKLDLISKNAHKDVAGKHYGSLLARKTILKHLPLVALSGHIHESFGTHVLGKTLCINTGSAHENKAALLTLEKNKKPKVKFV